MLSSFIDLPFQTSYRIDTNCQDLISSLQLMYGDYIKISEQKTDYKIKAIKSDALYNVYSAENFCTTKYPLQELNKIIFDNTVYDDCVFALHGSAVEWNGKAYGFLASTTSGKTTLASYLASCGFNYIADDCILLKRDDFKIYPYSTPIHLRDGGLEVLKHYDAAPKEVQILDAGYTKRYVYMPDNCMRNETPLTHIFFITRTESENKIIDMSTTERMTELLKAPITDYRVTGAYLKFISEVAKIKCNRLLYSDMAYVAEAIRHG